MNYITKILDFINKIFDYFNYDGCKHIIVSAILTVIISIILPNITAGILVLLIGLCKEFVYDKYLNKGVFDYKDIIANVIGILIGII